MIYTVFCSQSNGEGTMWIGNVTTSATDLASIRDMACNQCAIDWDTDADDIVCVGVIEGNAKVLSWEDEVWSGL